MIARGSHSFACHPLTNYTCLYSPAAEHHRPLAGTHCAYTEGWPGWVYLGGWLYTEIGFPHRELNPDMVTPPSTNWAGHRLTSLTETNVLPLSQTANHIWPVKSDCAPAIPEVLWRDFGTFEGFKQSLLTTENWLTEQIPNAKEAVQKSVYLVAILYPVVTLWLLYSHYSI